MLTRRTNRRKVISTLIGLTLFATLAIGSGSQVVTVTKIIDQVSTVVAILEAVDQTSDSTLDSVDNAYQDLGVYLRENNFTTDVVISMEEQYAELDNRFSELQSNFNRAQSEASTLFRLLRSRADENTNPEFKQAMISQIGEKEDSFNLKIGVASQVLSRVEKSIQQYNDILGFAQVTVGLDAVNVYIEQVNSVLAESDSLSVDIEKAIEEASEIIESSAVIGDSSQNPTISSDEVSSIDDQFPKPSCGDDNPSGIQTFYPVFVSPADQDTLRYIRTSYCGDALAKNREDVSGSFIQVASFQTKEKAMQFSNILLADPRLNTVEIGSPSQL